MPVDLDPDQVAALIREASRRDRTDSLESLVPDLPLTVTHRDDEGRVIARVTPFGVRYNWQVLASMLMPVEPMPESIGVLYYTAPPEMDDEEEDPEGWAALARAVASVEGDL